MTTPEETLVSLPIEDLVTDDMLGDFPEGKRLVGTECIPCRRAMIGERVVCSDCLSREVRRIALPTTGVLYSFTRLHVGSAGVRPVGYIDLDNGVRTFADIQEADLALAPDIRVELRVDGDAWAFEPIAYGK